MNWTFRALALIGAPTLVYLQISRDVKGIAIGVGAAVAIIVVEMLLERIKLFTLVVGVFGAVLGMFAALLLNDVVTQIQNPVIKETWSQYIFLIQFMLGYLGMMLMIQKFDELGEKGIGGRGASGSELKVLDTSAVIDGRIMDICQTKFLSGTLVVPRFVLNELHHLADSQDSMKRARGRRGLDILARMQEDKVFPVKIMDKAYPETEEVDSKLVRLAKDLNAFLVTTDFNLNKICALEGVVVLNVNDLSAALKPVVLPGEHMSLFVMREGKERDQGVGYLDDGTMVVIEDGKRLIGKRADVSVVSILQTSAGRMIFAKGRGVSKGGEKDEPVDVPHKPEKGRFR